MRQYSEDDRGISIIEPNIEHVLPQSPQKWGYSKEQVSEYVNKIGNLTILHEADNNDAGNEVLDYKIRNVYTKSKFKFNRDIEIYKKAFLANPELAINERGKDIAKQAFSFLKIL